MMTGYLYYLLDVGALQWDAVLWVPHQPATDTPAGCWLKREVVAHDSMWPFEEL